MQAVPLTFTSHALGLRTIEVDSNFRDLCALHMVERTNGKGGVP
jgi:hypothetical protein